MMLELWTIEINPPQLADCLQAAAASMPVGELQILEVEWWNCPVAMVDYTVGLAELKQKPADSLRGVAFGLQIEIRWRKVSQKLRLAVCSDMALPDLGKIGQAFNWKTVAPESTGWDGKSRRERSVLMWGTDYNLDHTWSELRIGRPLVYPVTPKEGEISAVQLKIVEYLNAAGQVVLARGAQVYKLPIRIIKSCQQRMWTMPKDLNLLRQPAPEQGPGFINPYNFVRFGKPAARRVAPTQEKFTGLSGQIECEIELLTPLCIPDAEASGPDKDDPDRKNKRFSRVNGDPYIAATEIKGAVRSVAEAVSGSCLSVLSQQFHIFRDNRSWVPGNKKLGKLLANKGMPSQLAAPHGINENSNPEVFPRRGLKNQIRRTYNPRGGNLWNGVNEDIPAEVAELYNLMVQSPDFELGEEPVMPGRHATHWQDKGVWGEEDAKEWLADYENHHKPTLASPYWWFRKASVLDVRGGKVTKLTQIGRNFRYKWAFHILQAIPVVFHPCEKIDELCPVCRLFGWVAAGDSENDGHHPGQPGALAGRVMFSPAHWIGSQPGWGQVDALKILNTPKPSCRSFYLKPESLTTLSVEKDEFLRVNNDSLVTAPGRGRKFYWHHVKAWKGKDLSYLQMLKVNPGDPTPPKNKLNSDIEVLLPAANESAVFAFNVSFENLEEEELGLLLWSLALPEGQELAHHLGLGKPLGLGSVKIKVRRVSLIDRKERYEKLFEMGTREEEFSSSAYLANIITAFRSSVKTQNRVGEFKDAENVADLIKILNTGQPSAVNGAQVRITYPPGLTDVNPEAGALPVNREEIHHTWFGVKGWGWSQRLLTIAEIASGKRQLK